MTTQPPYVTLEPGVPVRLRIRGWRVESREIRDPASRTLKLLDVLVLDVTHVNEVERTTTLSLTSFKAQQTMRTLLESGIALRRPVEIVRRASGYLTEYEVRVL